MYNIANKMYSIFDNNLHFTISHEGKNVEGLAGLSFEFITCRLVEYDWTYHAALSAIFPWNTLAHSHLSEYVNFILPCLKSIKGMVVFFNSSDGFNVN